MPSVSVGTKYSARDHDEEFEPLPNYDAGYVDTDANIGIAFSDIPESWPDQWPIETALGDTFMSIHSSPVPGCLGPCLHQNTNLLAYLCRHLSFSG